MTIRNKSGYEDRTSRIGSELEPLTWGETVTGIVVAIVIAILTVEFVIRLTHMF